jgi:hypothetical protein
MKILTAKLWALQIGPKKKSGDFLKNGSIDAD